MSDIKIFILRFFKLNFFFSFNQTQFVFLYFSFTYVEYFAGILF
jgi:hypothetical protein